MASPSTSSSWHTLAASKCSSNHQKIPPEWLLPSSTTTPLTPDAHLSALDIPRTSGLLNADELELTSAYDATALLELMASGQVKSEDVVRAFCKRAAIAQQCVNCLTEIMFDEALARARECDEYLRREGRVMGALHGLPVSLKDSFNVKGVQATIGYVSWLSRPPSSSNSHLVDLLLDAGAVFYCKTNLPQTMMTADSHNNVFGRTLNPHKLSHTAGGSTGGEGALLAMRGSILGLATDIAGSNRIPALCNGVKSFKPSAGRVPFGGGAPPGRLGSPGSIVPVIGPVGWSVRDLELTMQTICNTDPWRYDENVLGVPWRTVQPVQRPLRFGLIRGHLKRPLHPPIARALHSAATQLKAHGHQIILLDDQIPDLWDCAILAWKFFMLDPKKTPVEHVKASGEPWVPSIATCRFTELDSWEPSLDNLWDMNVERATIVRKYHDLIVQNELDAVLMPGYNGCAPPHDTYGVTPFTVLQNLLNYPAGILPYLKASKELDDPFFHPDTAYEPPYNAESFEGLPAHVQIMGKPMRDEELMEILKIAERILREKE